MNRVLDTISKVGCFVLCIILFVVMFFYLFLNAFTSTVTSDNVSSLVSSLDIKNVLGEEYINSLYEESDKNGVDRSIVDGLVNSIEFRELVGKIFGNVIDFMLYDKENDFVTVDEIMSVMEKQIDRITMQMGVVLSNEERNDLLQELEMDANDFVNSMSIEEELNNEMSTEEIESVRFLFSGNLQTILLIVIAIIVLLLVLFRWSIYRFAIWTGITTVIVSGAFAVLGMSIKGIINAEFANQLNQNVVELLNKNLFGVINNLSLFVFVIGVVQIIYYFIIRKSSQNVKI